MSEQVIANLDHMVAPLKDLMDKGIFEPDEIRSIVQRRRESEYLLLRRSARKLDYLRYIEAERKLERLRSLRRKKLYKNTKQQGNNNNNNKKDSKNSIGDAHVVQLIHLLFVRAKRKWKEDVSWYFKHAEFAKEAKSFQMLGKIYAEAIQMHPRNSSLWIAAASHEYFGYIVNNNAPGMSGGGSIRNARVLLQRGIRVNQKAEELWLQYFCLEFHYIQKLRGRKEIMQPSGDDNKDTSEEKEVTDVTDGAPNSNNLINKCQLPRIIFNNAIQSIDDNIQFRLKFLDLCDMFPETSVMEDVIMLSIEKDFGHSVEGWIARAQILIEKDRFANIDNKGNTLVSGFCQKPTHNLENNNEGSTDIIINQESLKKRKRNESDPIHATNVSLKNILKNATDAVNTPEMYLQSIFFLHSCIKHNCHDNESRKKFMMNLIDFLLQKAEKNGMASSPDFILEKTAYLVKAGKLKEAFGFLEKLITNDPGCQKDVRCWMKWALISSKMENNCVPKSDSTSCEILRKGLEVLPIYSYGHFNISSQLFLNLLVISSGSFAALDSSISSHQTFKVDEEISSLFQKLLLISHKGKTFGKDAEKKSISIPELALVYLQQEANKGNITLVRKVYSKVLFNSNYTKSCSDKDEHELGGMKVFFDSCIQAETSLGGNSKEIRVYLNRIYDIAIQFFQTGGCVTLVDLYKKQSNDCRR